MQGRFTIAAKHHITVAEIYESELVDIEKVNNASSFVTLCDVSCFIFPTLSCSSFSSVIFLLMVHSPDIFSWKSLHYFSPQDGWGGGGGGSVWLLLSD